MAKDAFNRKLTINFVLEDGHKNAGDAERIFEIVKTKGLANELEREIAEMLSTITFGDKKQFPGLQAADVNAYSGYQHESGQSPLELVTLEPESCVKDAQEIQKVPIFRIELGPPELTQFKQFIMDEIEERKAGSRAQADSKGPSS
jgi:hypothetical protein